MAKDKISSNPQSALANAFEEAAKKSGQTIDELKKELPKKFTSYSGNNITVASSKSSDKSLKQNPIPQEYNDPHNKVLRPQVKNKTVKQPTTNSLTTLHATDRNRSTKPKRKNTTSSLTQHPSSRPASHGKLRKNERTKSTDPKKSQLKPTIKHQKPVSGYNAASTCYRQDKPTTRINAKNSERSKSFGITVTGDGKLSPNRSAFQTNPTQIRCVPAYSGIEENLPSVDPIPCDLIIGLDFGTSSVKVVINDHDRSVFYGVPFYPMSQPNPYVFPSRVYLSESGYYSLEQNGLPYTDLKLPLMEKHVDIDRICHAIAFLALIIRHARGWLFSNHESTYRNSDIAWAMNLGLPVAYTEEAELSKRFKQIALAALNLAGTPCILSANIVKDYLNFSIQALDNETSDELIVKPDMVNVYPEIGAQIAGFLKSETWDAKERPFITLVDVGAGTVDISFFSVERKREEPTFRFFQNSVKPHGVINLHRKRIDWLKKELKKEWLTKPIESFLTDIAKLTDEISSIPENVNNYIINLHTNGEHVDKIFYDEYKRQVRGLLEKTHSKSVPNNNENWRRLPIFLCGGGSRMKFYDQVVEFLNSFAPHWLHVEREKLTKPSNLRVDGLSAEYYDRLSVAYGLSFQKLGEIIPSSAIKDLPPRSVRERPIDPTDDG